MFLQVGAESTAGHGQSLKKPSMNKAKSLRILMHRGASAQAEAGSWRPNDGNPVNGGWMVMLGNRVMLSWTEVTKIDMFSIIWMCMYDERSMNLIVLYRILPVKPAEPVQKFQKVTCI